MVRILTGILLLLGLGACTPAGVIALGTVAAALVEGYCAAGIHSGPRHSSPIRSSSYHSGRPVCRPPEVLR